MLEETIKNVMARVAAAAKAVGTTVKVVAATKTVAVQQINGLKDLGITAIGENRVQELLSKWDSLECGEVHFIGALQTNKVKYIADKVCCVQSVDRIALAEEIDKRCAAINKTMPVLIEVNIGGEDAKSGCDKNEVFELIESVKRMKNIRVDGLMSVLPIGADARLYDEMRRLYEDADKRFGGMKYLSMGMSDDFELAISRGATMVRLGSILFGRRPPKEGAGYGT